MTDEGPQLKTTMTEISQAKHITSGAVNLYCCVSWKSHFFYSEIEFVNSFPVSFYFFFCSQFLSALMQ